MTTKKKGRNGSRSGKRRRRNARRNQNYMIGGAVVLFVFVLIIIGVKGCGGKHRSPEGVVEALVKAGVDGKERSMKKCYDVGEKLPEGLQAEIDATIKYYKAHKVSKLKLEECEVLSQNKDYTYVYIRYNLVLENEQEYPCITTYMVKEKDKKYYVFAPSEITKEMSEAAASAYAKFMTTETYKNYIKAYDTFIKKNPGYEEKIAGKTA